MKSYFLSFDLGASSGRAIVTVKEKNSLKLDEVYRFPISTYKKNDTLYWNFSDIILNIKVGLRNAFAKYPKILSVGIDTWGVDYGLISHSGELLSDPISYRDTRGKTVRDEVYNIISYDDLYCKTGIQYMHFNTIYQLAYDVKNNPELLKKADKLLLLPDLIAFFLTGAKRIELTNLSTTNFYDFKKKSIIEELEHLGNLFPEIIYPGETYGIIKTELAKELGIKQIPVVAVCSHDTASAILSIPLPRKHIYISSGTWSLCGTLLKKPITSEMALKENYTNEIGYNHKIRFLKNIMGLWIVNQCQEKWSEEGKRFTYSELERMALASKPFMSFIDPDAPVFAEPGNMPAKIQDYCLVTGQYIPQSIGEIFRCVYQSMAFKYRYVVERLEKIVNYQYKSIVIVGGGSNIALLNQMTSSATKKDVVIGPQEASTLGNALILMLQANVIGSIEEGKKLIKNFIGSEKYSPLQEDEYDRHYQQFCKIIER